MGRKWGAGVRAYQREHVKAREALEERYEGLLEADESLAELVTGEGAKAEPHHRWLPFRQQFSPGLVRRFLAEAEPTDPVLDPFSGSGTVAIECARAGRAAIGVEGIPVLAWLTAARFRPGEDARVLELLATARSVTGEGRAKAPPPEDELRIDARPHDRRGPGAPAPRGGARDRRRRARASSRRRERRRRPHVAAVSVAV